MVAIIQPAIARHGNSFQLEYYFLLDYRWDFPPQNMVRTSSIFFWRHCGEMEKDLEGDKNHLLFMVFRQKEVNFL